MLGTESTAILSVLGPLITLVGVFLLWAAATDPPGAFSEWYETNKDSKFGFWFVSNNVGPFRLWHPLVGLRFMIVGSVAFAIAI
jgi:hypothetical protein